MSLSLATVPVLLIKMIYVRLIKHKNNDMLGDLNKPLPNQNILTMREAKVYLAADVRSEQFAVLAENTLSHCWKIEDRLSNTWYQVNIGDRLGMSVAQTLK